MTVHLRISGSQPACLEVGLQDTALGPLFDLWDFHRHQLVRPRCDACLKIAALHMRTNEGRAAFARGRRSHRFNRASPLMRLGTLLGPQVSPWREISDAVLDAAFVHCELRAQHASMHNARGRATSKWLGTWLRRIAAEIDRRDRDRRAASLKESCFPAR